MRVAVTGPDGFLAWHLRCSLKAREDDEVVPIGRPEFRNAASMDSALEQVDCVIHLAGINRAPEEEIATVNPLLAKLLGESLIRVGKPITVVNANSTHSYGDSVFGQSKMVAAEILNTACQHTGGSFVDVVLPNVFGEHGKPYYNSVTATFCHQLVIGDEPKIDIDRELLLVHAQEAATILLDAAFHPREAKVAVGGHTLSVSCLLEQLHAMSGPYSDGKLPDLSDPFTRNLFNTYRSYTFPKRWPILPVNHSDDRGELVEAVRCAGGETQVFFSATRPGFTRGNHFHLHKVERFLVLDGEASIKLRRLFTDDVVEFKVTGKTPAIIDMPTLWTHSITNTGGRDLLTLFYADDQYNPDDPDTYWVNV